MVPSTSAQSSISRRHTVLKQTTLLGTVKYCTHITGPLHLYCDANFLIIISIAERTVARRERSRWDPNERTDVT